MALLTLGLNHNTAPVALHWRHFHDLLDAFLQDLRVTRYDSEAQVLPSVIQRVVAGGW